MSESSELVRNTECSQIVQPALRGQQKPILNQCGNGSRMNDKCNAVESSTTVWHRKFNQRQTLFLHVNSLYQEEKVRQARAWRAPSARLAHMVDLIQNMNKISGSDDRGPQIVSTVGPIGAIGPESRWSMKNPRNFLISGGRNGMSGSEIPGRSYVFRHPKRMVHACTPFMAVHDCN